VQRPVNPVAPLRPVTLAAGYGVAVDSSVAMTADVRSHTRHG